MSITESKAVISVTADTKQAVAEINKLADAEGKRTEGLKKQAESTNELGKKWEELSKSMVGLQLHDAFKRVSDGAKEASGGVLDLNMAFAGYKVAGPWGAAIGLVGGALAKTANIMDGVGVSFDELDKKAKEFKGHMPELTSEVYRQAEAVKAMNDRLAQTPAALAAAFKEFARLYPLLNKVRQEIQAYDSMPAQVNRGLAAGGKGLQNFIGDAVNRYLGVSGWNPLKYKTATKGGFDSVASGLGGAVGEQLGGVGSYPYLEEMQRRADAASSLRTSNMIRSSADFGGYAGLQSQVDAFNAGEFQKRNAAAYGDFNAGQQQSFLEKTFGPVDQFDIYAQGFQMLSGAVGSSLSAWIDGSASAGEAFKKFIGEALKGIAVQMAMESLKHGAYALGSLAFGDVAGAATHGKAALMFGTGAALAAGAAKAFHSGGSTPATGGGRAPNVTGGGSGGGSGTPERIIVYGDPFAEDSPRGRQRQAKRMVSRALGNSSIEVD